MDIYNQQIHHPHNAYLAGENSPRQSKMNLDQLPTELLLEITSHLTTSADLRSLLLCCRHLKEVIETHGWRSYVLRHHSIISSSVPRGVNATSIAKGAKAFERNWAKRSILARDISPNLVGAGTRSQDSYQKELPPVVHEACSSRQSMSYVPVIDSYEELVGNRWDTRKELLAWACGSRIVWRYRVKEQGLGILNENTRDPAKKPLHGVCHERDRLDGKDDYTVFKIIRSEEIFAHENDSVHFKALAGTASGKLSLLDISCIQNSTNASIPEVVTSYSSTYAPIRDIDIANNLVVTASSGSVLRLFNFSNPEPQFLKQFDSTEHMQTAKFLSDQKIVVGKGRSKKLLQVFQLSPTGFSQQPIWEAYTECIMAAASISKVLPLPVSVASNNENCLFLAGQADGCVSLQDIRDPRSWQHIFTDQIHHYHSTYALLAKPPTGLLVGSGIDTNLKLFDLRISSSNNNRLIDDSGKIHSPPTQTPSGFSVFLLPRSPHRRLQRDAHGRAARNQAVRSSNAYHQATKSAVYSLSSPSPSSSTVYAGLVGRVVQLEIADVFDRHADPVYRAESLVDVRQSQPFWDPRDLALELSGFNHSDFGKLLRMNNDWSYSTPENAYSLDRRWRG